MTDLATTVTVIDACGRAHVPVLLLSDPGVGKSSLVRGIATAEAVPCETVLGSVREPADVAGLPVVGDDGSVNLAPPSWARRLCEAEAGWLFLDELTTCPPAVQDGVYRRPTTIRPHSVRHRITTRHYDVRITLRKGSTRS